MLIWDGCSCSVHDVSFSSAIFNESLTYRLRSSAIDVLYSLAARRMRDTLSNVLELAAMPLPFHLLSSSPHIYHPDEHYLSTAVSINKADTASPLGVALPSGFYHSYLTGTSRDFITILLLDNHTLTKDTSPLAMIPDEVYPACSFEDSSQSFTQGIISIISKIWCSTRRSISTVSLPISPFHCMAWLMVLNLFFLLLRLGLDVCEYWSMGRKDRGMNEIEDMRHVGMGDGKRWGSRARKSDSGFLRMWKRELGVMGNTGRAIVEVVHAENSEGYGWKVIVSNEGCGYDDGEIWEEGNGRGDYAEEMHGTGAGKKVEGENEENIEDEGECENKEDRNEEDEEEIEEEEGGVKVPQE
ncbi:hypothetical protein C7212DRAFT_362382 [Tuber magnatum]|uniref:Uncharacterized protein n=1 Tax=Tuber magnatum TaxID=42249 RepID=A0A317SU70_9PEZI|nr:hypothetical protein C7212DRAFT_362382 [Tuber magnatum]